MIESRLPGNEHSAIHFLKVTARFQAQFRDEDLDHDGVAAFATLDYLATIKAEPWLPREYRRDHDGAKYGYLYALRTDASAQRWAAVAWPLQPGRSGKRCFGIDESGVLLESTTGRFLVSDIGRLVKPADHAVVPDESR